MTLAYFPLYVNDFEGDTAHLSIEEDGAYNRLLRLCWRTPGCSIPAEEKWIRRQMRVDQDTYDRVVAPIISEFFRNARGRLYSPRLSEEYERAAAAHEARVEAGKRGADARKKLSTELGSSNVVKTTRSSKALKTNDSESSNAPAMLKQCLSNQNQNQNHNYIKERVSKDTPKKVSDPLFEEFWKIYPRKVGKGQALTAWRAAAKKVDPQVIIEGLQIHLPEITDKPAQFQPHASTWLNGERWGDELEQGGDPFWADFKWE